jgi:hypothetical protein
LVLPFFFPTLAVWFTLTNKKIVFGEFEAREMDREADKMLFRMCFRPKDTIKKTCPWGKPTQGIVNSF